MIEAHIPWLGPKTLHLPIEPLGLTTNCLIEIQQLESPSDLVLMVRVSPTHRVAEQDDQPCIRQETEDPFRDELDEEVVRATLPCNDMIELVLASSRSSGDRRWNGTGTNVLLLCSWCRSSAHP